MKSEDIADAVTYVVGTPNNVSVSEMVICPTRQLISRIQIERESKWDSRSICVFG